MEGTQPSAAGGDGAPTAMVAVPGQSGALTQGYPLLGGSGTVSMEASLRLRAKDYAAHDRWLVNLQDVITSNRLDDLWENQQVPTLEAVQRQFTQETSAKQQELFAIAMIWGQLLKKIVRPPFSRWRPTARFLPRRDRPGLLMRAPAWPWRVRDLRPPSNGCSRSGQLDRASVSPTC